MECEVRLRQGYGGQPSRGLPTVAHADVDKRERRLVTLMLASWNRIEDWLRRFAAFRKSEEPLASAASLRANLNTAAVYRH